MTPVYQKPYNEEEFSEAADDEESEIGKRHCFNHETDSIGSLRMSAL